MRDCEDLLIAPFLRPSFPPSISAQRAFTLLELVIALLLIALLVGMVFGTARSSLMLGNNVVQTQNEEMLHQAFFELLENRFAALPGNTRLELTSVDSGSHYISDLTMQNVPLSFTWGGEDRTAKAIQISTVKRRSGFLDIVLRYYENEILDTETSAVSGSAPASPANPEKPFAEIILLTDVRYFEWKVLDGRTLVPDQYEWDLPGRLPLQLQLNCAFGIDGDDIRQVFWIPPRQNPEVFMRQLQQNQGNGAEQGLPGDATSDPIKLTPGGGLPVTPPTGGGGGSGQGGGGGGNGNAGGLPPGIILPTQ